MEIIQAIEEGIKGSTATGYRPEELKELPKKPGYTVVPDRREAIRLAVRLARPGDMVLVAGKGHETYQILGTKTLPFDDREEVRKALE